jgi:HrpA-like RNA helicase
MPARTEPEMLRTELQATCLQAKALVPSEPVADTLRLAMDPPSDRLITLATDRLERLGAFAPAPTLNALGDDDDDDDDDDDNGNNGDGTAREGIDTDYEGRESRGFNRAVGWGGEGLTYMGRRLASLPLEPIVGRMLLLGGVFRCVEKRSE